jgi:hypothetical protein
MKLSEAMRVGSQLVPRIRKVFQYHNLDGEIEFACAIGAACFAQAPSVSVTTAQTARTIFPQLIERVQAEVPGFGEYEGSLEKLIVLYNDDLEIPTEDIISLVEALGY